MISDADVNGDGKVNFDEFKAILLKWFYIHAN